MTGGAALDLGTTGALADNIVHFARALRKAGVRVGPSQVHRAIDAVAAAGFSRKADFYHILRACLINRPEHLDLFHRVFTMFWRDPEYLERMIHMMSPLLRTTAEPEGPQAATRRAEEALGDLPRPPDAPDAEAREEIELNARFTYSASETLRAMDFEQMSAAELAEAEAALRALRLPLRMMPSRRTAPAALRGAPDLRATLRRTFRRGAEVDRLIRRAPTTRAPDLVALCDISGSMSVYSRMLLLFLHTMARHPQRGWGDLHAFTFGTRLTNVTRALATRDADAALAAVGQQARDWQGGTRIGAALGDFNRDWARRVLGRGAAVLLITDGLERDETHALARAAKRLHLMARQVIWLNPLLRFDGFAPLAGGVRALLPHVDHFHACHSLDSLDDLARALAATSRGRA